jgi:hypothetical protein
MRTVLPHRVAVAGAQLRMLVLAADTGGCVGVDMESGAFVRATYPGGAHDLAPYDVAVGEITEPSRPVDQSRPESVALVGAPRRTGSMTSRRAERWLEPLQHPRRGALLGFPGRAVPYWTLAGDRPSLTLVELATGPQVRRGPFGYECRFTWQGARHQLPLLDQRALACLDEVGWPRYSSRDVQHLLGHRVRRLLVVLTPPHQGYCYKVVASLLPAP